nr:ribonuclease H-like domain-containing protein [Tanacetum cinerariifolium]
MDLRWPMAMLTMRARWECRSLKDPRRPGAAEPQRRTVPVETLTSNALVSQCDESDCESWPPSSLYDRFQPSGGYHTVPPSYTGTFIPPKLDLVFNTAPTAVETDHLNTALNDWLSDSEPKAPQFVPSFAQSSEHVKSPRHTIQQIKTTIPVATPTPTSPKSNSSSKRRNKKACFVCKSVEHLIKDCNFHTKKMAQPTQRSYSHRGHHKQYASLTHSKHQKHLVPTAVLTQSKPVSNTDVRPVSVALPNITGKKGTWVWRPKCPILDHDFQTISALMTLKRFDYNDALGRSKYMTGNMSYLSEFEEFNGGYVSFGGNPKGGKIIGKGNIKTSKLDFEDVYLVKELKFNLLSISQMCDKMNSVLFTETKCLVLSSDFKLPDES